MNINRVTLTNIVIVAALVAFATTVVFLAIPFSLPLLCAWVVIALSIIVAAMYVVF
jgi:hypothetical protein